MEIAVNTRLLLKNKLEGIGWFTFETLKRITQQHPEHHFYFIFDRDFDEEFIFSENITPIVIGPQARHPFLFIWWFELSVYDVLKKLKPDIFLSPDGYLSLKSDVPSIAVIHDINFAHYPKDLPYLVRKYYNYFFPRFAKKATRIATVSEYSKKDIHETYGIENALIDVVYNGVNSLYKPLNNEEQETLRNKITQGSPYFIFVGALHPRKNISNLLLAFDAYKEKANNNMKLILVGEKYWWNSKMESTYSNFKYTNDVVFTGRLSATGLASVMASATALAYIPYHEGFGIPILEAMCCNVPVITSNVTSMPEVAEDAALLVDPFNVSEIAEAMHTISTNEELRKSLIEKGQKRQANFSWDKTANALWQCIEKTVKAKQDAKG